jgi:Uma2 family endonuclease
MPGTGYSDVVSQRAIATDRIARLTVEQVHAMLEQGILEEGAPIELIDGVLVYKDRSEQGTDPMTIGKRHALAVKLLGHLDPELTARGCHMQTQGPLSFPPTNEPEPDGAVLRGHARDYTERLPTAADALSVIEVSDASLATDRGDKLAMYARANIAQYVIVNLRQSCIEVHEKPAPQDGRYEQVRVFRAGDPFSLRVGDTARLAIDPARLLP